MHRASLQNTVDFKQAGNPMNDYEDDQLSTKIFRFLKHKENVRVLFKLQFLHTIDMNSPCTLSHLLAIIANSSILALKLSGNYLGSIRELESNSHI